VTAPIPHPLPFADAIRDALGLVRLLYASRKTREATLPDTADPLASIGADLTAALELSSHAEGTLGHRAAVDRANAALVKLRDEVTVGDGAARLLHVARARVVGERFAIAGRAQRERR
jgi:hypothetical protein